MEATFLKSCCKNASFWVVKSVEPSQKENGMFLVKCQKRVLQIMKMTFVFIHFI